MATFVLVHGAWHGAWCWYKVAALLQEKGHNVIVPDLPGHGIDSTQLSQVTSESYTACIVKILEESQQAVVLVGHSMGGFVISQAAEHCPEKVDKLVYLAAVLASDGTSLGEFLQRAQTLESGLQEDALVVDEPQGVITVNPDCVRNMFYADCSEQDVVLATMLLTAQSLLPFVQGVQDTSDAKWGAIKRYYIECLEDKALPLILQREACQKLPCETIFSLDTGHSPFFSKPHELVDILTRL